MGRNDTMTNLNGLENRKQTTVKVNKQHTILVTEWEGLEEYEVTHMETKHNKQEISNKYMDGVQRFSDLMEMEEFVSEIVSSIVVDAFNGRPEVEAQVEIKSFTYNIWVAVSYIHSIKELSYHLSTVHSDTNILLEDDFNKNKMERKTWKGLKNYIERFSV